MCVRRYEDNWGELKGKLMERDVLEVLSFSAFDRMKATWRRSCATVEKRISTYR